MQMPDHKVVLGSPEWIAHADGVVRDILAEHGEEGQSLRICEVCVDAPPEIRNDDRNASWVITIDGKTGGVEPGRSEDAEYYLQATWELELAGARTVYTPEYIAEQEKNPTPRHEDPNLEVRGDVEQLPEWMMEFHNRMAVVTA